MDVCKMIRVRRGVNILDELAKCGFTAYVLRKANYFSESSIQRLRKGGLPSWKELDFICNITRLEIQEVIEFIPDNSDYLEHYCRDKTIYINQNNSVDGG